MAQVEAKSTGGGGTATRPMTGEEYRESLRDGREIWIHGERVEDVTTHPAFRNGHCGGRFHQGFCVFPANADGAFGHHSHVDEPR